MLGKERIEWNTLLEVLRGFQAFDIFQEFKVSISVYTSTDYSLPVDALELDVRVVLLEIEVKRWSEVNVRALDCVHVIASHFELIEVEVLGEDLHYYF